MQLVEEVNVDASFFASVQLIANRTRRWRDRDRACDSSCAGGALSQRRRRQLARIHAANSRSPIVPSASANIAEIASVVLA